MCPHLVISMPADILKGCLHLCGGVEAAVDGKLDIAETIECVNTCTAEGVGWEPLPHHEQMAPAPVFTAAAP